MRARSRGRACRGPARDANRPTRGVAPRPVAAASSSPARYRPTWWKGSAPCPASSSFPYAPVHVGPLQGAPPGAVRLDGGSPLPPGATSVGEFFVDTATPRAGGPDVFVVPRCASSGRRSSRRSAERRRDLAGDAVASRRVHASPPGTRAWPGIVNLESRFWSTTLPDARAAVALDGYVVSVVAHPIAYAWSFGDGTVSVGASPGGPDGPARVTFRRRGDVRRHALRRVGRAGAHLRPAWGLDFGDAVPRHRHAARGGRVPRGRDPGAPPNSHRRG